MYIYITYTRTHKGIPYIYYEYGRVWCKNVGISFNNHFHVNRTHIIFRWVIHTHERTMLVHSKL